MHTLDWLETHIGSLDDGINLVNRFHWFLSVVEEMGQQRWFVKSGESIIFSADSQEQISAFLYGMSLAYAGIPDPFFDQLVELTKNWME